MPVSAVQSPPKANIAEKLAIKNETRSQNHTILTHDEIVKKNRDARRKSLIEKRSKSMFEDSFVGKIWGAVKWIFGNGI